MPHLRLEFTAPIRWTHGVAAIVCCGLVGCDTPPPAAKAALPVIVQSVEMKERFSSIVLTGEIRARVQSDMAFRFAGRVASREVDVGQHVVAGQILAKLEPDEQTADVNVAKASVQSAEATLRQTSAVFDRQKQLMTSGFTTQSNFDNASQAFKAAQAALDGAKASLDTAQDQLENTVLRADEPGIVTARNVEAGQVVEAAQSIFTVAKDGPRDAVFEVFERLVAEPPSDKSVQIMLLANTSVQTRGTVREVAPAIDPSTGTVRVKIGIDNPPPEMGLGAPVSGIGRFQPRTVLVLPWTAFFVEQGKTAVWTVDPKSNVVAQKFVTVDSYRTDELLLREGLAPGEWVVTAGLQLLRPGQVVAPKMAAASPQAGQP